jgi:hypothetical protein
MSRLQVPITGQVLSSTGDVRRWVTLELLLQDGSGNWCAETFRVDSATDITTFPAYDAKRLGLPMPIAPSPIQHQQTGLVVRSDYLRFRVVGMDATVYVASCLFLGDPDTPPDPSQPANFPRLLLQPLGLLDRLRFTLDKQPNDGTPHGTMTVEKK